MDIDYDHAANRHGFDSARAVLPVLFERDRPRSLLDVGCGTGTWLHVARAMGVEEIAGVDGVKIPSADLLFPIEAFHLMDLSRPWNLHRTFDLALCLEVAEHLDESAAPLLIQGLTGHADRIVFSAACPDQPGQHHVNCQWPGYWQALFNRQGFVCSDAVRWQVWSDAHVDVWYRQNMFEATRDQAGAGKEERIKAVIHPDLLQYFSVSVATTSASRAVADTMARIEDGSMPLGWYASSSVKALVEKARRRLLA